MKMLVVSDTHRFTDRTEEVYRSLEGIDLLVHLGDHRADAEKIGSDLGVPYIAVRGNCDGAMSKEESETVLDTDFGPILLTHGHMYGVYYDPMKLLYTCQERGYRAAFFGHTHQAFTTVMDGVRLMNPGSLTNPRDGSSGSYGIATAEKDSLECTIHYYGEKTAPKKKARGGFLRGIMNYSDGQ
ncbi:MAG: metallophosphoesterase [Eubacteriaceae bacterium]|jgi:putative phosphoesterase|nr:metallophosphoesterase [Eubacteriaceae bacterium]